ncbi:putative membrane protein [Streptacidiphilus sp. MAP12-16]|jgi:hypothetical protein|uniref:hypothetical protein n=1 Tax=Streptacidiphilus sp. MAP12-16 TaxID=3156300 RepID=UPI0035199798
MSWILARYGLVLSGWLALAATTLPAGLMPLRAVVTAAFLLVCPGAAALRLTHPTHHGHGLERLEFVVLSVAFSITIDTLVAEAFFFSHSISTMRAIGALAVLTSLMALYPVRDLWLHARAAAADGRRERRLGP